MRASTDDLRPVVALARRTPFGRVNGMLRTLEAHELLAPVLGAVAAEAAMAPGDLDDVVVGNAVGGGGNVARLAALTAGFPHHVPGLTVDRQCASGLDAIVMACRLVASGAGSRFLAGGVESCSTAPLRARRLTSTPSAPDFYARARFAPDDPGDPDAGTAAENVARAYGIPRSRQDAFAEESHRRAVAAAEAGTFAEEMVPLGAAGEIPVADQGPRSLSAQFLARFPPAFEDGGSVTAGNSCADADGAVVVLVTSVSGARDRGLSGVLEFIGSSVTGCDPNLLGVAGAHAANALLQREGLPVGGFARVEFNEAFAAQVLASADLMGIPAERLNADGGSLAYGHPYGASGARLVANLLRQARNADDDGACSLAAVSAAGGVGTAAAFRYLSSL